MLKSEGSGRAIAARQGHDRPPRRRGVRFAAGVAVAMISSLLLAGAESGAAGGKTEYRVFGPPDGQHGLTVNRYLCNNSATPTAPAWQFSILGGSPWGPTWQPHAIAWTPTGDHRAQGVETYFAEPARVDVFRIWEYGAPGENIGFANVWYYPPGSDYVWRGLSRLSTDVPGWGTWDVADHDFDWYRYTGDESDGTTATGTVAGFAASQGGNGEGAYFSINFGCDGKPFAVDGFEVGNSTTGWNAFNFEGYKSEVSLSTTAASTNRCAVSVGKFPRQVRFRGSLSESGGWRGWQWVGVGRDSKWRRVAAGSTAGSFSYRAKVSENSWFDASYGPTATHEYADSRDIYVPAFPSIELRAGARTVVRGRRLVVTGVIRPARPLSFAILQAVPQGRQWSQLKKIGSQRADKRGRFRFNVPTGRLGWNSIDILTKTGHDLTTTISRRSVHYKVIKPKAPPPPNDNGPSTTVSTDDDSSAGGNQPDVPIGGTHKGDRESHPIVLGRPRGYGACGWYIPGRPPSRAVLSRANPSGTQPVPLSRVPSAPVDPSPVDSPEDRYLPQQGHTPGPKMTSQGESDSGWGGEPPPVVEGRVKR